MSTGGFAQAEWSPCRERKKEEKASFLPQITRKKVSHERAHYQGCQMAKFDPFLSLDCARVEGMGAQSKERNGSDLAA